MCSQLKKFKNGPKNVKNEPQSGRFIKVETNNNAQDIRAFVHQNQWLTIQRLADELNINYETARNILIENFPMTKLCTRVILRNLSEDGKFE